LSAVAPNPKEKKMPVAYQQMFDMAHDRVLTGGNLGEASGLAPQGVLSPLQALGRVITETHAMISRLETLADRLCGPVAAESKQSTRPDVEQTQPYVFPAINQDATHLLARLTAAHAALARIEEAAS
jgi:hypothetical protein